MRVQIWPTFTYGIQNICKIIFIDILYTFCGIPFYNVYEMIMKFNCWNKKENWKIYRLNKISEECL